MCLCDFIDCSFEETREQDTSRQALAAVEPLGQGATVIGSAMRATAAEAAFVNAVMGHGLVREDMHAGSVAHIGVVVLPALLALELAGKAEREAVAKALRSMNLSDGAARYFPGGRVKFDNAGRREGAGLLIVQWQDGVPVSVYPQRDAVATPRWPAR